MTPTANGSTRMIVKLKRESLDPGLIARITKVWEATKDVQTSGLDEMIAAFCADGAPEREIVIWELIAQMYTRHAADKPKEERGELYSFFLDRTMNPFIGAYKTIDIIRARELDEEMKEAWKAMSIPEDGS